MPAQWYTLSVSALSGPERSIPVSITCQTDPRGVIAGVLTVLLAILILCIGIFIWHHRSRLFSNSKFKSSNEPKLSSNIYKPIPLKNFPMHFSTMSRDQNCGFIGEYEDLSRVGTDQSCAAATLPENKSKNCFTNVLAYDSSRVKIAPQTGSNTDYINANYIHGYDKEKQYIAAQGPLPSTVNDFWRMVWEQKSSAIVMLTNCTEGGRIKCEQYWPMDDMPCLYGNVRVSVLSEQKESCWTRRALVVRNESASEAHIVAHFQFTEWPDHGVPTGTEALIQFRWIVRQHIETFSFSGPTVVHCSNGVGRTGTLIALDLLLQQMDKEEEVSVADCVHRMRLSRPLMVETQSQYVFLHQCIMDSLKPEECAIPEPIYENPDIIYANALVLRQFKADNPGV
ncbi:receptor-type tyrosine-protein phosphatase H-like [Clarias gariepinus]